MEKYKNFFILFAIFIYYELIFKIALSYQILTVKMIPTILYLLFLALVMGLIFNLIKNNKVKKGIIITYLFITTFWYGLQIVLINSIGGFYTFNLLAISTQVLAFPKDILSLIMQNIIPIIFLFIPPFVYIFIKNKEKYKAFNYKQVLIILGLALIILGLFFSTLLIDKKDHYSQYNLFFNLNENNLAVPKLGVKTAMHLDIVKFIFKFEENLSTEVPIQIEIPNIKEYEFNNLDIVFETGVKDLDKYFANDSGTLQNEYTGMFEGKNLILILAESFSEIAVSKELTPTLYKLTNEGFVFTNFYSPTINSTIGGEFQLMTGIYPGGSNTSLFEHKNISYPFGVAKIFDELDYKVKAYHNGVYAFQHRHHYLKRLGFKDYLGCGNGLEKKERMRCIAVGHTSDSLMIDVTTNDYINEEQFFTYYITVTGHAIGDGTYMISTHQTPNVLRQYREALESLNVSEVPKGFVATQMELDKALALLIERLKDAGKLEDTVIVLAADHDPYRLSLSEINELSTYKRDEIIERCHNNFIIWNSEMDTVIVDKVGSTIDVLPTIYNLFNIKYDSRLIVGNDMLSNTPGLAMFGNRSWVSDYGHYYANGNKFVPKNDVDIPENYVSDMKKIVDNKINVSRKIMSNNYYNLVKELK